MRYGGRVAAIMPHITPISRNVCRQWSMSMMTLSVDDAEIGGEHRDGGLLPGRAHEHRAKPNDQRQQRPAPDSTLPDSQPPDMKALRNELCVSSGKYLCELQRPDAERLVERQDARRACSGAKRPCAPRS